MAAIGSMDSAYFVGRGELLQWINSTLQLNLNKIEQTASGAVACQLLDALHPGVVNLSKVDFNAKNDYEYINNYKVLQAAFNKLNIDKSIEVNKLIKARPLDNMEFMQWFKSYFDQFTGGQPLEYDGPGRRAACKTGDVKGSAAGLVRPASSSMRRTGQALAPVNGTPNKAALPVLAKKTSGGKLQSTSSRVYANQNLSRSASLVSEDAMSQAQVQDLTEQVTDLKIKVDNVERERDFYYNKLRDIELLCQDPQLQSNEVVKIFERILYAADEEEAKAAVASVTTLQ